MKLEDWIEIHSKDSFEKLVQDTLSDEIYWLKCSARDYGAAEGDNKRYWHDEMYHHVERINWIRERILYLYKESTNVK